MERPTSGNYTINYSDGGGTPQTYSGGGANSLNDTNDFIVDTDPYPAAGNGTNPDGTPQCSSPQDTKACIMDADLQTEVDKIIQHTTGTPRGLHDLWYVFLPPNVDECISQNVCGTNAFGAYHSLSDVGHGVTIYALGIDPIIEAGAIAQGADPQGNPDGELAADIAAHETNEAMTDPEGVGWMDPNGYEVADKCEFGPSTGPRSGLPPTARRTTRSSTGTSGSPRRSGRRRRRLRPGYRADEQSAAAASVNLNQFSTTVTGDSGKGGTSGTPVEVQLIRAGTVVADQNATTTGGRALDGPRSSMRLVTIGMRSK